MIINFHPREIPSKKGLEVIEELNPDKKHQVVHSTDKSADEWRSIIDSDEELILVAPIYWWGPSYEFDKWVQEVFSYDYAFKYLENGSPQGLLNNRPFSFHLTHGTPTPFATVMNQNITTRLQQGIFGFCGAKLEVKFYAAN